MDTFEERLTLTAQHFSSKDGSEDNINIVFQENANPRTDGKNIYLPTNLNEDLMYELLIILIHECSHIKYSNFGDISYEFASDPNKKFILNVLEDIRVDAKTLRQYPEVKDFYIRLMNYTLKKHAQDKDLEDIRIRILKSMWMKSIPVKPYCQEAEKHIVKLNLDKYVQLARKAKNTGQLLDLAREIYRLLYETPNNGLPQDSKEELQQKAENLKKQIDKKASKLKDKSDKTYKDSEELNKKFWEADKDEKKARSGAKRNAKRADKLEKEIEEEVDSKGEELTEKEIEKKEKQLANARTKAEDLEDDADEKELEKQELKEEQERKTKEANDLNTQQYTLNKISRNIKGTLETDIVNPDDITKWATSSGFSKNLIGIEGLADNEDFISNFLNISLPKTLHETLREFFTQKREERVIHEDGVRLNPRSIPRLFTDCQNLWTQIDEKEEKTKVIFLIDMSGSMSSYKRDKIVTNATACLWDSLKEVIETDNLPVEVAVYYFDDRIETAKTFEEKITGTDMISKYRPRGGTNLSEAVEFAKKTFDDSCVSNNEKKILVIMTDGDVGTNEAKRVKDALSEDIKQFLIGINVTSYTTKDIFYHNIQKNETNEILGVLKEALFEGISK